MYTTHDTKIIKNNDLFEGARHRFFVKIHNLVCSFTRHFLITLYTRLYTSTHKQLSTIYTCKRWIRTNTAGLRTITEVIRYCCKKNYILKVFPKVFRSIWSTRLHETKNYKGKGLRENYIPNLRTDVMWCTSAKPCSVQLHHYI